LLRSLKELEHYAVSATDGDTSDTCADFLLDDERWIVRYLVVETGGFYQWAQGAQLSPSLIPSSGLVAPRLLTWRL